MNLRLAVKSLEVEKKKKICRLRFMLTPIRDRLSKHLEPYFKDKSVAELFEIPKELDHGHLSIPVFSLAREYKKAPPVIAKEIANQLLTKSIPGVARIEAVGGYINFHLDGLEIFSTLYNETKKAGQRLGFRSLGAGQTIIVEYSSPNVAKPMHVGHLRATVIGQALRNLADSQGYKVIGLNHLGDWGVQFGKLAYAYRRWGSEYDFENDAFESLYKLYVRFHQEAEKDPEMEREGSLLFKKMEDGDPELLKLWRRFVDISMNEYEHNWQRLGVKHDLVRGESFYNDRLKNVEKLLQTKGLLIESEGAMVVDLSDEKMPPCLIFKSDGASLYATRDIASAIFRFEELKVDASLYVVGAEQTLHFKQLFSVLRRLGFAWWSRCHHIGFGLYRFKDPNLGGKMSSRKGQIIRLEDLLNRAVELVKERMSQKAGEKERNIDEIAEQVGVGAIIFNDLVNDRVRDVEFDWEHALSFEGDSGPYVQYVHVRCASILAKSGRKVTEEIRGEQLRVLDSAEERRLIKSLLRYEDILSQAYQNFKPNILANYLLELCTDFNHFYHNHKILGGDAELIDSRLALVWITQSVIRGGLKILSMAAPQEM